MCLTLEMGSLANLHPCPGMIYIFVIEKENKEEKKTKKKKTKKKLKNSGKENVMTIKNRVYIQLDDLYILKLMLVVINIYFCTIYGEEKIIHISFSLILFFFL